MPIGMFDHDMAPQTLADYGVGGSLLENFDFDMGPRGSFGYSRAIGEDISLAGGGSSVTTDGTSGWAVPASNTEWTNLLSGTGLSNPASLWLLQEASGTFADSIGSRTLTGTNISYSQSVTGWSRKGIKATSDGAATKVESASFPDISTTSVLLLQIISLNTNPAAQRSLNWIGRSTGSVATLLNAGPKFQAWDQAGAGGTSGFNSSGVVVVVTQLDNTNSKARTFTSDGNGLSATYAAPATSTTTSILGDGTSAPDSTCIYAAMWTGSAAELTDSQIAVLIARLFPTSTATKDATSGWAIPQTASEWNNLVTGMNSIVAAPQSLWKMQEASGNLADTIGSATMTASGIGSANYQQSVSGWSNKAITLADSAGYYFQFTIPTPNTSSILYLFFTAILSTPAAARTAFEHPQIFTEVTTAGKWQGDAGSVVSGTAAPGSTIRPVATLHNIAASHNDVITDQEVITPTFYNLATSGVGTIGHLTAGGSPTANVAVLYGAMWTGSAAEMTAFMVQLIIAKIEFPTLPTGGGSTGPTDAKTRVTGKARTPSETLSAPTDTKARVFTGHRSESETLSAPTDTKARQFVGARSESETLSAPTDVKSHGANNTTRSPAESMSAPTDTKTRSAGVARATSETIPAPTDSVARLYQGLRLVGEVLTAVSDFVTATSSTQPPAPVAVPVPQTLAVVQLALNRLAEQYKSLGGFAGGPVITSPGAIPANPVTSPGTLVGNPDAAQTTEDPVAVALDRLAEQYRSLAGSPASSGTVPTLAGSSPAAGTTGGTTTESEGQSPADHVAAALDRLAQMFRS